MLDDAKDQCMHVRINTCTAVSFINENLLSSYSQNSLPCKKSAIQYIHTHVMHCALQDSGVWMRETSENTEMDHTHSQYSTVCVEIFVGLHFHKFRKSMNVHVKN